MQEGILVSIIVPVYNAEQYVEECVESVLDGLQNSAEILLLDDASTDNSGEICEKLATLHPEVKYHKLIHGGVSATRNAGLDIATGKYVFFLDSDGRVDKGLIDSLINKMESYDAIMGNSILREFGEGSQTQYSLEVEQPEMLADEDALDAFITGAKSLMAIGGKMMLRQSIGDYRFRTDLSSGEDTYFIYDILRQGGKTVFEYELFYGYRMHGNNTIKVPNAQLFRSTFIVYEYLYEGELSRVGDKRVQSIWNHKRDNLRNWMRRCAENQNTKELRHAILLYIKALKKDAQYAKMGKRFKLIVFAFAYLWPLYKCFYSGKTGSITRCSGCAACSDACPNAAIRMQPGKDGFAYPEVNRAKCTDCGRCNDVCPYKQSYDVNQKNHYYALQALDFAIREVSTSGGAFRLLAEDILKCGGVVVGAAMEELAVKHIIVDSVDDLWRLQGSKYVQSNTEGIYSEVKHILDENRAVLFSGTPCQVDALKRFLNKDYEKLYLVDLICNGVTSPKIWKRYTKYLEHKYKSKLLTFSFRDKRNCDDGHTIAAVFQNGERIWSMYEDKFCRSYFKGISLRSQCEKCLYCTDRRNSDLTIGDFWGVEKSHPELNDGMGTSLVIVHSEKGTQMLKAILPKAKVAIISESEAKQPRLFYSASLHKNARLAQLLVSYLPLKLWFKLFVG